MKSTDNNKMFEEFILLIKQLRAPDGCPWDKEQTFKTLTPHIIEEAYELVDAIESDSFENLKEELGDVLLHVVMLSNMAEEQDKFSVGDVIHTVYEKMVRRHPHVFSDTKVNSVDEVWENWESIKKKETKASLFDSVPRSLPALLQGHKVQKKAARLGFDWKNTEGPAEKIKEEIEELLDEIDQKVPDQKRVEEEFGDLLFSMVNMARKLNIDPEEALRKSNRKFMTRIESMDALSQKRGKEFSELSLEQQEELWQEIKSSKSVS